MEDDSNRHQRLAELDVTLHATERLLHFHLLALVESYERRSSLQNNLVAREKQQEKGLAGGGGGGAETLMGTVARLEALTEMRQNHQQSKFKKRSQEQQVVQKQRQRPQQQPQKQQGAAGSVMAGRHGRYGRHHQTSERFRLDVNSHFPMDIPGVSATGSLPGVVASTTSQYAGDSSSSYSAAAPRGQAGGSFRAQARSPEDSLLFSLIVHLQLCMIRIEEADMVLCGWERALRRSDQDDVTSEEIQEAHSLSWRRPSVIVLGLVTGLGAGLVLTREPKSKDDYDQERRLLATTAKVTGAVIAASYVRRGWRILGINARITHTTTALEDWQHQWVLVQSIGNSPTGLAKEGKEGNPAPGDSSQLLELIEKQGSKSLAWHSYSALRFLLIKRTMDLLYASVGAAMEMTKGRTTYDDNGEKQPSRFWMPIATAAAASYYNIFGPTKKSAEIVSSSSQDFVKNAWGVVSLPAVKHLSLQASRILKGAAIADRIEIANVPCVVLSCAQCPRKFSPHHRLVAYDIFVLPLLTLFSSVSHIHISIYMTALATALKRFRRQQERETSHLCTIMEGTEDAAFHRHSVHVQDYPKHNVILHLTGGGFFAHTLAGDFGYLLDWSRYTNSVVICPEYALLPEHRFPAAFDQTSSIYSAIVSGDAGPLLGFRPERLIVTGEAAGGNLAAALCVKLCMDKLFEGEAGDSRGSGDTLPTGEMQCEFASREISSKARLPDALMLSCPMLNMSLELTPSRVKGTNDPVLPSGLIKTISDSYLPLGTGVEKTDPVASPYYASDDILRLFPPTLICESSGDPLLDDSVDFNTRLKRLGVESDLKAVHNMPHAFWGLASAGFPEAKQCMVECSSWLQMMFCSREEPG